MKKHLKAVISVLLAFVLFASAIPAGTINAFAEGKLSSKVTYEEDGTAIVTLEAGDFYNAVRYTTDGSVPTIKSKLYVMPIEITEKTLIRAAEFDGDKKVKGIKRTVAPKDSDSVSEKTESTSNASTANGKTGKITFKVTQLGNYKAIVELECETPGVEIRYTTDGTKPDEDSNLYENGIVIVENTKILARAYKKGYKTTTTYGKTIGVKLFADFDSEPAYNNDKDNDKKETVKEEEPKKETEKESAASEKKEIVIEKDKEESSVSEKISYKFTYMDDVQKTYVTLLKSKTSNIIRYTTDGSAVSKNSKIYSKRVGFTEQGVFRAKEYTKTGELVATLSINVKIKCGKPEYICTNIIAGAYTIEMNTITEGAEIYYTTDGKNPTEETGLRYTGPITLAGATRIKAIAIKDGYVKSATAFDIASAIKFKLKEFDFSNPVYEQVAGIINRMRKENGVHGLVLDKDLTEAANVRARELSVYYSNSRPSGASYSSAIKEVGLSMSAAAEYIDKYSITAQDCVNSILKSDSKKYLTTTNGLYDTIGIGCYSCSTGTYWAILLIDKN